MRDVANGTLTELLGKLDTDELRRGKQFEKIVKWWLQKDAARTRNLKTVWLWDEWPDRPGRDIGVDLVAELIDGSLCAIQAKCFNSERDIPKSEIDSFISAASPRTFTQRWLVATTNNLSANARRTIHDNHVTFIPLAELEAATITWPNHPDALKASKKAGKAKPRPHQQRAIRDVLSGLETNSRGQLIMACGTGKTLTALWITERLDTNTTLVLVPSLNLLSQTLTEWAHNTQRDWTYICVCSDDTVNKEDDQPINTTVDLPYPVTTKPSEIANFLKSKGRKIVFSTYQSSAQVAKAQKLSGKKFDLTICDEAHRLTGKTEADYATVLDEKKIISKKRLFMTATPRTYTANVKAKAEERGVEITSMDDPHIYGTQLHKLTFGEAIKQELLTDYQVVIVGVTDPQVQDLIDRRELVSVNDTVTTDARTLAAHIGLAKATKDFNLARTISFHSRIKTAAQFANDHPKILEWLPATHKPQGTTWTDTISGDMNTGQRRTLLQQLRKDQPGRHALLTNARCLTEGVDVPTLDGVAFIDPRSSQVDIIQAVGRAIRRSQTKNIGTIVLPVLIPASSNPEQALTDSAFKTIWSIINALKSHDLTLANELDQFRMKLGRLGPCSFNFTKVRLDLPSNVDQMLPGFIDALTLGIIERSTSSWEFYFGLLQRAAAELGTTRLPADYLYEGKPLGVWISAQRRASRGRIGWGELTPDRRAQLETFNDWVWDPWDTEWEEAFALLSEYAKRTGTTRMPRGHKLGNRAIDAWCTNQRASYKNGDLTADRKKRLAALPNWSWDPKIDDWNQAFETLVAFQKLHGHLRVPKDLQLTDGRLLFSCITNQRDRHKKGKVPAEREALLESIPGWSWDFYADMWQANYEDVLAYATKHHKMPEKGVKGLSGSDLAQWVMTNRVRFRDGAMPPDQVVLLNKIPGWSWDPESENDEKWISELLEYQETFGHLLVPMDFVTSDGIRLGAWVSQKRVRRKKGILTQSWIDRLNRLEGWAWSGTEAHWLMGFNALATYSNQYATCKVPRDMEVHGLNVWRWIERQVRAIRDNKLPHEKKSMLESLQGWPPIESR